MVPIKTLWKSATKQVMNHGSTVLACVAVSGVVLTAGVAIKVAPKAHEILENKREAMEKLEEDRDSMTAEEYKKIRKDIYKAFAKDIAKACWPLAASIAVTTGSIIGMHKLDTRKSAALAATLSLTEGKLKDYQDKVKETVGEKKEQKIRDEIARDKVRETPIKDIMETGHGDVLCLDAVSGRYFKCNADYIRARVNVLNQRLLSEMYIPLNDLYYELHLPNIKIGEDIGWNINQDGLIDLAFSSQLTENDIPVLVLDYTVEPRFDYRSLH